MDSVAKIVFTPNKDTWRPNETFSGQIDFSEEVMKSGKLCDLFVFWTVDSIGIPDVGVVHRSRLNIKRELTHHFSMRLPVLPLSYSGELFRIRWLVRVRLFKRGTDDVIVDREFRVEEPENRDTHAYT